MGSRLGKVHIANLLNMIFLGVSSCCPFSSVNWALVFHRLGHAFVALGGWAASVGCAGTRARHFPASGGGPFGRALTWTYWMARSGGREPKTWTSNDWVGKINILDFIQWIHCSVAPNESLETCLDWWTRPGWNLSKPWDLGSWNMFPLGVFVFVFEYAPRAQLMQSNLTLGKWWNMHEKNTFGKSSTSVVCFMIFPHVDVVVVVVVVKTSIFWDRSGVSKDRSTVPSHPADPAAAKNVGGDVVKICELNFEYSLRGAVRVAWPGPGWFWWRQGG